MSVIYSTTCKAARHAGTVSTIGSGGKLVIMTSADVVLATLALANPAGTVSGGVLTLTAPISDTGADATGTAAKASIRTSGDVDVITGLTVGTSGADINLSSTSITAGVPVAVSSATITHA